MRHVVELRRADRLERGEFVLTPQHGMGVLLAHAVEGVEPLGNEIFVHARAGDHRLTARVAPQPLPAPGEPLELGFDLGRLHFFDPETERSLTPEPQPAA